MTEDLDRDVRVAVYRHFVDRGAPPSTAEVAEDLGIPTADAEAAFRRLEAGRVLVFAPGTLNIWLANPLSATPTPFRVETSRGTWWGSCVWDGLGVLAMLGSDGTVATFCPDCNESFELRVEGGALQPVEAIVHFAVPARRWWENIGFS